MKKVMVIILALSLVFSLCACGGSSTQKPINADDGSQQSSTSGQPSVPEETAVTIENAVLLDQDGLVITAKELVDDSIWGMGVKVLVENNSEKNLCVQCKSIIVNNYMITDFFSCSVAAGKKSNETIYLSSSGLEAAGITTISDIVISFHVFDTDSYSTLFDTAEVRLRLRHIGQLSRLSWTMERNSSIKTVFGLLADLLRKIVFGVWGFFCL